MSTTRAANETNIKFDGEPLAVVQRFTYLGSVVNERANLDCEIRSRINAASRAFWKLRERVFDNHDLSLTTKLAVYRAVVIPTLLYGCESWVTYSRHVKDLERIQQRHLRRIMRIRWFHYISNQEVLSRAKGASIEVLVSRARLRWVGHVLRMEDNRLPKSVLYGEMLDGRRKHGGQCKRYKDILHENLKSIRVSDEQWEQLASNRTEWRRVIHTYEGRVPARRPNNRNNTVYECPDCGRRITSRIYARIRVDSYYLLFYY